MTDLKRFFRLKEEVEQKQRQADRLQGALEQSHARMKQRFGIGTLEQARDLLGTKEREVAELERQYDEGLNEYQERWKDELS